MNKPTRALRELTEGELAWTVRRGDLSICEWETMGLSFVLHKATMRIVRCGILGGDVRDVHGGWQYGNEIALLMDWQEIKYVATVVR